MEHTEGCLRDAGTSNLGAPIVLRIRAELIAIRRGRPPKNLAA